MPTYRVTVPRVSAHEYFVLDARSPRHARQLLTSGRAFDSFRIIKARGGHKGNAVIPSRWRIARVRAHGTMFLTARELRTLKD